MTSKYGIALTARVVVVGLAAFFFLASLDDGSDYSPYGSHAGASSVNGFAASQ